MIEREISIGLLSVVEVRVRVKGISRVDGGLVEVALRDIVGVNLRIFLSRLVVLGRFRIVETELRQLKLLLLLFR